MIYFAIWQNSIKAKHLSMKVRYQDSLLKQLGELVGKIKIMERQPKNPFHPGEMLLEEFLEPMGMSQVVFAEKIGWSRTRLRNAFIRGERGVTADSALDLAETLGTSARLWMNLQATYDLDKAAKARRVA